ncbi:hypothetical protein [Vibrio phage vB_VmeM-Yong XC32]|nr:hypothetical protein [Vibrio phage vB_VmeM-Yong XC31]QAX96319.1 hypothetical protein [Vibrio phage vB_VmeM-Yong XC32]QAX96637.1 hypothetical protein [Vibrio phage vB_VmeM-Yong MS31]QAX96955.1 hypothetical protein [Vibrio phage vB_VmeM-Yong MS32]
MNVVFLNQTFVEALKAYGIKLDGSEGLTNLADVLEYRDVALIRFQTDRMIRNSLFSNMGFTTKSFFSDDDPHPVRMDDDEAWDVFMREGSVSPQETNQRLRKLNCVASADGCLVFFEDETNEKGTLENALNALSYILPNLDAVMQTPVWRTYLKNC